MKYRVFLLLVLAVLIGPGGASAQLVIPLWGESEPPYHKPNDLEEYEDVCWLAVCAYQVVNPTLTIYPPQGEANGAAVVVLPGGGYEVEAVYHEGYEIAEALSRLGTAAAVLKYRLPNPETSTQPELVPSADVRQALSLLRERQQEFGFTADRFGVLGFSAGGHLAAQVSVHAEPQNRFNPDFSVLVYGVSQLNDENRKWLEKTLYHRAMTAEEVAYQTLLDHVDASTPPAFLVHAWDDETCHYRESTLYAEALNRFGVDNELHLFAHGGHGFGSGRASDGTDQWLELAAQWLRRLPRADSESSLVQPIRNPL
ncbi:MAG: alpha/beta hydrolase [Xanthomonadales bacterium]|jgi:acetyl esterase/lipase|nr:alpha/beta hydrolase [Xanthomonadales bacterium]